MLYPCLSSPILCINEVYLLNSRWHIVLEKVGKSSPLILIFKTHKIKIVQELGQNIQDVSAKITAVFYSQVVWFAFSLH